MPPSATSVVQLEVVQAGKLKSLTLTTLKRSLNREHLEAVVSVLECHASGLVAIHARDVLQDVLRELRAGCVKERKST